MSSCSSAEPSMEQPTPISRPPKRLLFDRRYGWVYDEWKDPSEEASAGGRGMFCIVPITKAFLKIASQSISFAADSVARAVKDPNQFSPKALHANLSNRFHELTNPVPRPNLVVKHPTEPIGTV